MALQLPLSLQLSDEASFANFVAGPNQEIVAALQHVAQNQGEQCIYIWGAAGNGKSHLLQALCQQLSQQGQASGYLPLGAHDELSPAMLEDLANLTVVCLDDVEQIGGRRSWEVAVFRLFNEIKERGHRLIVASAVAPQGLALDLADLTSRFCGALTLQLQPLPDEIKLQALQLRAKLRGMVLDDEVGRFLMRRSARDMPALVALLDRLDQCSLAAQRRLTIPFVKEVIAQ